MKIGASIPRGGEINSKIHEAPNHRELEKCENCAVSTIRQKNIRKSPREKSKIPGHRLYVDMSGKLTLSAGGSKYWLLVADEATDMKFSFFM